MIEEDIILFREFINFEESLNKYSIESELESEEQARSFFEGIQEEKITKEISILISTMNESTTDSINIHLAEVNDNSDDEREEIFTIITRGASMIPCKPRAIPIGHSIQANLVPMCEASKQKSLNVLIHRPIPKKKN